MAKGSIRIPITADSSDAKKELIDFEKYAVEVSNFLKKMGQPSKIGVDVKDAEKQLLQLEKKIQKLKEQYENFQTTSSYQKYQTDFSTQKAEKEELIAGGADQTTTTYAYLDQLQRIQREYSSVLQKAGLFEQRIREATQAQQVLNQYVQQLKQNEQGAAQAANSVSNNVRKTAQKTSESASSGRKFTSVLKTANSRASGLKGIVLKIARTLGSAASSAARKLAEKFKNIGKSANKIHKKVLKIGLVMLGMRGVWGGLRQLVSSALSNNEKLQNQLTALKGALAQAIAPAMNVIINALAKMVSFADKLYQVFTGVSFVAKYNAAQAQKQAEATADTVAETKKLQMASFDVANALSDTSTTSSDSSSSDDDSVYLDTTSISGWMQQIIDQIEIGDWSRVGSTVASKIVSSLQSINWNDMEAKAYTAGSNFAEFINGLFTYTDADGNTLCTSIGETIGKSLNTVVKAVQGVAEKLKWSVVGEELAKGIKSMCQSIKWDEIIKTSKITGTGFAKLVKAFFLYKDSDGKTVLTDLSASTANLANSIIAWLGAFTTEMNERAKNGKTGWYNIGHEFIISLMEGILTVDWTQAIKDCVDLIFGLQETILGMIAALFETNEKTGRLYIVDIGLELIKAIITGAIYAVTKYIEIRKDIANLLFSLGGSILSLFQGSSSSSGNSSTNGVTGTTLTLRANLVGNISDSWKKVSGTWDKVTATTKTWTSKLAGTISKTFDKVKNAWDKVKAKTKTQTSKLAGKVSASWKKTKEKWDGIRDKISTVTAAVKDKVTSKLEGIINGIIDMLNGFIGSVNKILGKFNKNWKIGTISKVKLARGGIVNTPGRGVQATIGEAGAEAVLPIQNHTEWMDEIAEKSAEKVMQMFSGITLVNYMDGKQISREVVNITKRRQFATGGVL